MLNVEIITSFFGWCTVINSCVLLFMAILLTLGRSIVMDIHSKLMGINKENLPETYFTYLANYKIAILILNLSPYIALKFFV